MYDLWMVVIFSLYINIKMTSKQIVNIFISRRKKSRKNIYQGQMCFWGYYLIYQLYLQLEKPILIKIQIHNLFILNTIDLVENQIFHGNYLLFSLTQLLFSVNSHHIWESIIFVWNFNSTFFNEFPGFMIYWKRKNDFFNWTNLIFKGGYLVWQ